MSRLNSGDRKSFVNKINLVLSNWSNPTYQWSEGMSVVYFCNGYR